MTNELNPYTGGSVTGLVGIQKSDLAVLSRLRPLPLYAEPTYAHHPDANQPKMIISVGTTMWSREIQ
jgi:hypothetical protein